jgi:hypothetical protein
MTGLDNVFIDYLKSMLRTPSVTGFEHAFFRVIQRELDRLNIKCEWHEGVLVAQGANPSQGSLSAHVDRHGLLCTGPNEFKYAAYSISQKPDLLGNSIDEVMLRTIASRFVGNQMIAYEPWSGVYRGTGTITSATISEKQNNVTFQIEGLDYLVAGEPVAYEDSLNQDNNHLTGQIDNAISVAMILYLYSQGYQGRAFFTAGEECGRSWQYLLNWFNRFDPEFKELIVLDTSPYKTQEDADAQQIALRYQDANGVFNRALVDEIKTKCEGMNITYAFKEDYIGLLNVELVKQQKPTFPLGTTELGRLIDNSDGLLSGISLQIPTCGYHTRYESAHKGSCLSLIALLKLHLDIGDIDAAYQNVKS